MKLLQPAFVSYSLHSIVQVCEEVPLVAVLSTSEPQQMEYSKVVKLGQRAHRLTIKDHVIVTC